MTNRRCNLAVGMFVTFGASGAAWGYELPTHGQMVQRAFERSFVASTLPGSAVSELGLTQWIGRNPDFPFRTGPPLLGTLPIPYSKDIWIETDSLSTPLVRYTYDFERKMMPEARRAENIRINGWLMRGGIREDDGGLVAGWKAGEPYIRDVPLGGRFDRFCNHFFDPIASRVGSSSNLHGDCDIGFQLPHLDSLQWALGASNPFDPIPTEIVNRRNHFTVYDARELMWKALTLTTRDGVPADQPSFNGEDRRKVYWASAFRALGSVVHLLQDKAQPQHTRDEGHGPGHTAGFEQYIAARSTGALEYEVYFVNFQSNGGIAPAPLDLDSYLDSYGAPKFSRYSDYWRSGPTTDLGVGLADYSNRGFYTTGNNVGGTKYSRPNIDPAAGRRRVDAEFGAGYRQNYIYGSVTDALDGSSATISLSTEGLFKVPGQSPRTAHYLITRKNEDDRVALLIPRAVAYSTGLINYFFRGKLQIGVSSKGVYGVVDHFDNFRKDVHGFSKLQIKIANLTASISPIGGGTPLPQEMSGGKLVAIVKFHRNTCYTPDLSHEYRTPEGVFQINGCRSAEEEIVVSNANTVTTAIPRMAFDANFDQVGKDYEFVFPAVIPINATDLYLQVVYRGPLGEEADAVVVATKDITEPTFFSVTNITDYVFCYNSRFYYKLANGDYSATSAPYPPAAQGETVPPLPGSEPPAVAAQTYGTYRLSFEPNPPDSAPLVTATVAPNQFARIAVLTDFDRPMNRGIDGFGGIIGPLLPLYAINQVDYSNGNPNERAIIPETLRNVRSHYPKFAYRSAQGNCDAIPFGPAGHFNPFGLEPGYNGPAMIQATLYPPFDAP